jgi:Predicted permeases
MIIFWAINFPLIKIALVYENSFTLLFYRILFALIGMLIIFNRKIIFKVTRKDIPLLLFQSVFMVILFMEFWLMAESTISSALSVILIYMYPVLATVLSILFLKEYYNRFVIIGIIVGFSGIFLIIFQCIIFQSGHGCYFCYNSGRVFFSWHCFFQAISVCKEQRNNKLLSVFVCPHPFTGDSSLHRSKHNHI